MGSFVGVVVGSSKSEDQRARWKKREASMRVFLLLAALMCISACYGLKVNRLEEAFKDDALSEEKIDGMVEEIIRRHESLDELIADPTKDQTDTNIDEDEA